METELGVIRVKSVDEGGEYDQHGTVALEVTGSDSARLLNIIDDAARSVSRIIRIDTTDDGVNVLIHLMWIHAGGRENQARMSIAQLLLAVKAEADRVVFAPTAPKNVYGARARDGQRNRSRTRPVPNTGF